MIIERQLVNVKSNGPLLALFFSQNDLPRTTISQGVVSGPFQADRMLNEYYKGGPKTYGAFCLIISALLTIAWVRSSFVTDDFHLSASLAKTVDKIDIVRSTNQRIQFINHVWTRANGTREIVEFEVHYIAVIIPLMLVSIYLLTGRFSVQRTMPISKSLSVSESSPVN